MDLAPHWQVLLSPEENKAYFIKLINFLDKEQLTSGLAPPPSLFFRVFKEVDYNQVRVVILGQDPYPTPGYANGQAFAVNQGVARPKSLTNIFKEVASDYGVSPKDNTLQGWAEQGVFLLNTILSTRVNQAFSHRNQGWEIFTDAVLSHLNNRAEPIIFLLWGKPAQLKKDLITNPQHKILIAAHPSPLSAYRGFFGCQHFSKTNQFLKELGYPPIDWGHSQKF